ncbi:MAG TPA: hypothetical protein VGI73_03745 [Solirubrobacterales bacterium]
MANSRATFSAAGPAGAPFGTASRAAELAVAPSSFAGFFFGSEEIVAEAGEEDEAPD